MTEMKIFYSQFGEDAILGSIFNSTKGTCVEIGGFDGVSGSNSYFFEKQGWDCLIVEPIPRLYEQIRALRRCKVVCAAATEHEEMLDFFVAEGTEALSSIEMSDYHASRVKEGGGVLKQIRVQGRRLDDILVENTIEKIDFITIDVEGQELSVLKGFSLDKFQPRIVILEDGSYGLDARVKNFMSENGYVLFRQTGCNDWYVKRGDPLIDRAEQAAIAFNGLGQKAIGLVKFYAPRPVATILGGALRASRRFLTRLRKQV
jgi:FkbM family methyltransferase